MKNHSLVDVVIITAFLTVGLATAALTQPESNSGAAAPAAGAPAPTAPPQQQGAASSAYQDQGFAPGFDDLMTMLVQPRHIKLYYAGVGKNWELAAAEMRDLRSSFDRITQAIPNYEGNDVHQAVMSFVTPKMNDVDSAIAAADPKRFAAAYKDLTAGCNGCHTYMEHPFLVIRVPSAAQNTAHPDQDFKPSP